MLLSLTNPNVSVETFTFLNPCNNDPITWPYVISHNPMYQHVMHQHVNSYCHTWHIHHPIDKYIPNSILSNLYYYHHYHHILNILIWILSFLKIEKPGVAAIIILCWCPTVHTYPQHLPKVKPLVIEQCRLSFSLFRLIIQKKIQIKHKYKETKNKSCNTGPWMPSQLRPPILWDYLQPSVITAKWSR